jgi:ribosomal protein S18 acetylase RimI-like enzyme
MQITVRHATPHDIGTLAGLYERLESEMAALRPAWPLVDGLPEPVADAIAERISDDSWHGYVAELEGLLVGFLFARDEDLLPQAGGSRMGSIRLIYTDPEAREVGVGEALMERFLDDARRRGVTLFDAHVSPGHRLAKNFFEAHGFKARSIVMHRNDGTGGLE